MKYEPVKLTPNQFEVEVEKLLKKLGTGKLVEFRTQRLERIQRTDGDYTVDITARFEALRANILVLVECKRHKNPIKRSAVQVLRDNLRASGAHKGMLFATAGFQKGAIKYAKQHGIALIQIADGKTSYLTKGARPTEYYPSWLPPYVGWVISLDEKGEKVQSLIDDENPHNLFA
jgi:restriction system protein